MFSTRFLAIAILAAIVRAKNIPPETNVIPSMKEMATAIEILKDQHKRELTELRREINDIKTQTAQTNADAHPNNEQVTLRWCKASMRELRKEVQELTHTVTNSALLKDLQDIRNQLKQSLMDTTDLTQMTRTQEVRIDKLETDLSRAKYEAQTLRTNVAEVRKQLAMINKEMKKKEDFELASAYNDAILEQESYTVHNKHAHKFRHNKMVHTQISRLAKTQNQLDVYQQNLQTQILDVQRRLERFGEPNWDLVSTKVEFLELEIKIQREQLNNATQQISDFNKVHGSILELREDIENMENKADTIIPEFRKEISKLDVGVAQLNAQVSYLKEDQENLRQSVKAIAVSVSNAVDRAEMDRITLARLNASVSDLESSSKQHFYRLNDHILKSEANPSDNFTQIIPLPELMGEVKELQPVEREYQDLVNQLPRDCSTITGPPGAYLIHPGRVPFDTWCNNGTTLLQRRYNGSVEFNRNFHEYTKSFGDPAGEFWLGLDAMHELTADNCSSMRIDMTDIYGANWYAYYDKFSVSSADTGYVLSVGVFNGNASDAFEYQNHMEFSAKDRDRDISNTHCAGNYEGGWWYSHCQHVNINGKYALGLTWFNSIRNEWIAVTTSEMRLLRRSGCT